MAAAGIAATHTHAAAIYNMTFDNDPGWTTDQPENFYWDTATNTYVAKTINQAPAYDPSVGYQPNRYGITDINLDVSKSFSVRWDQRIRERQGAAQVFFGLYGEDLAAEAITYKFVPSLTPESTLNLGLGAVGPGVEWRSVNIYTGEALGYGAEAAGGAGQAAEVGVWYTNSLTFDAETSTVALAMGLRDSEANATPLIYQLPLEYSVSGNFSQNMTNLGVSYHPIGYDPPLVWSSNPQDYQITEFDNISVEGEYLVAPTPEPLVLHAPFYSHQPHYLTQGANTNHSHNGILENDLDFSLHGSDVVASAAGTVTFHSNDSFGNYAIVDHGGSPFDPDERLFTLYAHLHSTVSEIDGAYIQAGTRLGEEGSTGRTNAIHIHYGVYSGYPAKDPWVDLGSWKSVGVDGATTVFDADVSGDGSVERFTSPAMFDEFVCADRIYIESCRFYSLFERPDSVLSTGLISEGDLYAYTFYSDGLSPLGATLSWPGSELLLDVYDPTGSLLASISETGGIISFFVDDPMAGYWSFLITGIQTASGGEPFELRVNSSTPVPLPASGSLLVLAATILGGTEFARRTKRKLRT